VKFFITQLFPRGFRSLPVSASDTIEALDVVDLMIERGATDIKIIDAIGQRYDLIDLARTFDDELAQRRPFYPKRRPGAPSGKAPRA
jgi:hypothetical protein